MGPVTSSLEVQERASGAPGIRGGQPHHQPELDGIRGLAILAVLLSHAATIIRVLPDAGPSHYLCQLMIPGWGGVDVFFALSGFLITGILLRGRNSKSYFKPFYARRALRIFPIYYLFLFVTLFACILIHPLRNSLRGTEAHLPVTYLQKVSFFFYLQNMPWLWTSLAGGVTGIWGAYWSLAVEEQFYFVWPAMVLLVKTSSLFWICVLGFIGGPLVRILVAKYTGETVGLLHFPVTRLDGLFVGAALAFYRERNGKPLSLPLAGLCFLLGVALLGFIGVAHQHELIQPGAFIDRIGVSGFALVGAGMIALSQHKLPGISATLASRPLVFLGTYSYGIYIYHIAVFFTFKRLGHLLPRTDSGFKTMGYGVAYDIAAIAVSLGIARLSFKYIEAPALRLKRFFPSPAGAPVSRANGRL